MFDSDNLVESLVWDLSSDREAFIHYIGKQASDSAIVCSVKQLPEWLATSISNQQALILDHSVKTPLEIAYDSPETLGLDRLAASVGAADLYPGETLLVIDAGTCITYDLTITGKQYKGGGISPGLNMRYRALNHYTDKLPLIDALHQEKVDLGTNTQSSIQFGVFRGVLTEIDGQIEYFKQHFGVDRVVLTGGDTKELANHLKNNIFAHPDLLLRGLNTILKYQES